MTTHLEIDVEIAPDRGFVRIGATRVPVVAEGGGALRVAGTARLRALTVGERNAIVREALAADDARLALEIAVLQRVVIDSGDLPLSTLTALALAVAGGGARGDTANLPLDETSRLACEREGWSWAETLSAPAWLADRAALHGTARDDGWLRIVFGAPIPPDGDALARIMSENLLRRATAAEVASADTAVAGHGEGGSPSDADNVARSARSRRPGPPAGAIRVGKEGALATSREWGREHYPSESQCAAGSPETSATRSRRSPHELEDPESKRGEVRTRPFGRSGSEDTGERQDSVVAAPIASWALAGASTVPLQPIERGCPSDPAPEPATEANAEWVGHPARETVHCFGHTTPRSLRHSSEKQHCDQEGWHRGTRPPDQPVAPARAWTQYAYRDDPSSSVVAGPRISRPAEAASAPCAPPSRRLERITDDPERAVLAVPDWIRDLARALETECDLRGLDR